MMDYSDLNKYREVQGIAITTIEYLRQYVKEGVTEKEIANVANQFMLDNGASSFWYHGVGTLVLVGDRTTLSISGREYSPSEKEVGRCDLITVDLCPQIDSYWGDFARSLVVADGRVVTDVGQDHPIKVKELFEGIDVERRLHERLQHISTSRMTFEDLFFSMNSIIDGLDYVNLDFKGNLGHSIERDIERRIYIESGCRTRLSDAAIFTFEPHIKRKDGHFGFKKEDIYYFSGDELLRLD